jgi:HEAT repeat protein
MIGDEAIIQKIWPTIISSYNDDRVVGIRALGQLGTQKAKEIIMTKLDDDVLVVRLAAAAQLGKLNDQTGEEEVLKVFQNNLTSGLPKNEREVIDFFAALAIGEIATEPLMRNLPGFLENDSKEVRIAAAKAVLQCINKQ